MECCISHNTVKKASWSRRTQKAFTQKLTHFLTFYSVEGAEDMSKIK
ncbi:MAG: hypothetical protein R2819_04810 [Allomuricauda sp.]